MRFQGRTRTQISVRESTYNIEEAKRERIEDVECKKYSKNGVC